MMQNIIQHLLTFTAFFMLVSYPVFSTPVTNNSMVLSLYDSDTDQMLVQDVEADADGQFDLYDLDFRNFTMVLTSFPNGTQSVVYSMSGPIDLLRTENLAPYSMFGDNSGQDLEGREAILGTYLLVVSAYSESDGQGTLLGQLLLTPSFVADPANAPMEFSLVNTATNEIIIEDLGNTAVDVSQYNLTEFSIILSKFPLGTKSVTLGSSGPIDQTQLENIQPYALFGDQHPTSDDINGRNVIIGTYLIAATAYSEENAGGTRLKDRFFSLSFVNPTQQRPAIVNTGTDQEIEVIRPQANGRETFEAAIFSSNGAQLSHIQLLQPTGRIRIPIKDLNISKGSIYFIRYFDGEKTVTKRMMK